MKFQVDKIAVRGPKVDGGFVITLEVGEYDQANVAELLTLPQDEIERMITQVYGAPKETKDLTVSLPKPIMEIDATTN